MTKKKITLFCLAIPLLHAIQLLFFSYHFEVVILISMAMSFILITLLGRWEKTMQKAVTFLVNEKLSAHSNPKKESSSEENLKVRLEKDELKLHYEHQLNLLNSSLEKGKEKIEELLFALERKKEEQHLLYLENQELKRESFELKEEKKKDLFEIAEEAKRKEKLIEDYLKTISEQRSILEKKQKYIERLESKVQDLMYEIRSVLHLEENAAPNSFVIDFQENTIPVLEKNKVSSYDLSLSLKKYVKIAEKFLQSPKFLDLSSDTLELDLRQLFDRFQDEEKGILFVYSKSQDKLLFVNNLTKITLGWSQEKFLKDFPFLIGRGYVEWKLAISRIHQLKESKIQNMTLKNKRGEQVLADCYLVEIENGPFASHIMGLFSTVSE